MNIGLIGHIIIICPIIECIIYNIYLRYLNKKEIKRIIIINTILYIGISYLLFYKIYINKEEWYIKLMSHINVYNWNIDMLYKYDKISVGMYFLVNYIYTGVIIYSLWYIKDWSKSNKYILFMTYFKIAMIQLILSYNNLILLYGWEWVGLISFLLISNWNIRISSNKGSFKAIFLNRIGDLGLWLLIIYQLSIYNFSINDTVYNNSFILFFYIWWCTISKSAIYPYQIWLLSAMEGPTPVSALLHAATMVCAGAYILCKHTLSITNIYGNSFNSFLLMILLFNLIYVSLISYVTRDIKKIIALSTGSQLSIIIITLFYGYRDIGFFHLIIHGFFKALLFLIAGFFIHSNKNIQNIFRFHTFSYTYYILFFICLFSLSGFPILSGFYSKEYIFHLSYIHNNFVILFFSFFTTLFYSSFLIKFLFLGPSNKSYFSSFSIIDTPPKGIIDTPPKDVGVSRDSYSPFLIFTIVFLVIPSILFGYFFHTFWFNHINFFIFNIPQFIINIPLNMFIGFFMFLFISFLIPEISVLLYKIFKIKSFTKIFLLLYKFFYQFLYIPFSYKFYTEERYFFIITFTKTIRHFYYIFFNTLEFFTTVNTYRVFYNYIFLFYSYFFYIMSYYLNIYIILFSLLWYGIYLILIS